MECSDAEGVDRDPSRDTVDHKPIIKKSPSKRRVNKPMIERRRRERINECLTQLHTLISQMDEDTNKTKSKTKLEKADILEMAVDFVKRCKNTSDTEKDNGKKIHDQYLAGYRQCQSEISSILEDSGSISEEFKTKMIQHLKCKLNKDFENENVKEKQSQTGIKSFQVILPKNSTPSSQSTPSSATVTGPVTVPASSGTNILLCGSTLPTYVLVPTAALCQPLTLPCQQPKTEIHKTLGEGDGLQSCDGSLFFNTSTCSNTIPYFNSTNTSNFITLGNQCIDIASKIGSNLHYQPLPVPTSMSNSTFTFHHSDFQLNLQRRESTTMSQQSSTASENLAMWRPW